MLFLTAALPRRYITRIFYALGKSDPKTQISSPQITWLVRGWVGREYALLSSLHVLCRCSLLPTSNKELKKVCFLRWSWSGWSAHSQHRIFADQLLLSAQHPPCAGEEDQEWWSAWHSAVPEGSEGHSVPGAPAGNPVCHLPLEASQQDSCPGLWLRDALSESFPGKGALGVLIPYLPRRGKHRAKKQMLYQYEILPLGPELEAVFLLNCNPGFWFSFSVISFDGLDHD